MSDIFQEVHDDVRQEKYLQLWRAYGKYAIAAAMALVVGTAGVQIRTSYIKSVRETQSGQFFAALDLLNEEKNDLASAGFARLGSESSGYGVLARFRQAQSLAALGDTMATVEIYDKMAADLSVGRELRDLAALLAVMQLLESASADELSARLAPLITDNNPWRHSARELDGVAAFKFGDTEGARAAFSMLAEDPEAPPGLRARASEMLSIVGAPLEDRNND